MKSQIKSLKHDLKSIAKEIRRLKATRGPANNGFVPEVFALQYLFRHKHIAYCLARGRTLEQVENRCLETNKPDMELVQFILDAMKGEGKLYVIVRSDLSKSQQGVQAGHGVAAFLKKYPNTMWSNGTLVYVKYDAKFMDSAYWSPGSLKNFEWADFNEPDLGGKMTAIACFGPKISEALKNFELV